MQTKDYILAIVCIALGVLIGWLIFHGNNKVVDGSGNSSNASTSVVPIEKIVYKERIIYIDKKPVPASTATFPITEASTAKHIEDNGIIIDAQCVATGSVSATIYNNQIYDASSTTKVEQQVKYHATMRSMSLWDYLVQYAGWVALALYIIFKG